MLFSFVNYSILNILEADHDRLYRVEADRIAKEIETVPIDSIDFSKYKCIKHIKKQENLSDTAFFEGTNSDYLIRYINHTFYRLDYNKTSLEQKKDLLFLVNLALGSISLIVFILLIYVKRNILKPFQTLCDIPFELSKGNLTVPLKENKNHFFGKFMWGINLLREYLEQQKSRELEFQKEKKTLILSISHDIKTPLLTIKLYAKALSKNLYPDLEKQQKIAENIDQKANEIELFVSQIIHSSTKDIISLEVSNQEFYLSQLVKHISDYYTEKLALLNIPFELYTYNDCLLKGDFNRSVEVLQNIIENAIKYGDGGIISISILEEEDCRLISIKNSGNKLSREELPHIFDSFFRGSNVGNVRGSGLGLYICRQLMWKMDGDIYAKINLEIMNITVVFRLR